jgi:hypothetical protein
MSCPRCDIAAQTPATAPDTGALVITLPAEVFPRQHVPAYADLDGYTQQAIHLSLPDDLDPLLIQQTSDEDHVFFPTD